MYPTKEEILAKETKHKKQVILAVKKWKSEHWLKVDKSNQQAVFQALKKLIKELSKIYKKKVDIIYNKSLDSLCYIPSERTIVLNENLSIITALHEFAHHIFGSDETKACCWSVHLFQKTFPKAFEQLIWDGHMLIKNK